FFFFQAEDGIRDGHVTGVQTCALPICSHSKPNMVFVKHYSCLECEPWTYLTILDFSHTSKAFQFTYAPDHKEYGDTLEYKLPGKIGRASCRERGKQEEGEGAGKKKIVE